MSHTCFECIFIFLNLSSCCLSHISFAMFTDFYGSLGEGEGELGGGSGRAEVFPLGGVLCGYEGEESGGR